MESRRKGCCTLACVQPGSEQQMGFGKQNAGVHTAHRRHCEPKPRGIKRCWLCYGIKGTARVGGFVQAEQTKLRAVFVGKCLKEASLENFSIPVPCHGATLWSPPDVRSPRKSSVPSLPLLCHAE